MRRPLDWLLALPLCAACAKAPLLPAPTAATRCTVPGVGSEREPWRQVRATGFTFCVPAYWRPEGSGRHGVEANTWRGDAGTLTWGTGPAPTIERTYTVSMRVRVRTPSMSPNTQDWERPCTDAGTFRDDVEGATVSTTQMLCQGTWETSAACVEGGLYVNAESRTASGAAMQLAVIRTIRLVPRAP